MDPDKAVNKLGAFLKAKQFGMPRYVFALLLVGGVGVGLYLRRRSAASEPDPDAPDAALDGSDELLADDTLALDEAALYDPGLAGAGYLPGPVAGSVVPVQSPIVPEGLADILSGVADIFDVIGQNPDAFNPPASGNPPPTGGGPPGRRGNRVIGVLTPEEIRRLDREQRAQARRLGRRGVTRAELERLLATADTRAERRRIRSQVTGGQGFGPYLKAPTQLDPRPDPRGG